MNTRPYLPKFDSLIFDLDGTFWDASGTTEKDGIRSQGWIAPAKQAIQDLFGQQLSRLVPRLS